MTAKDRILAIAHEHYRPEIVAISDPAIELLPRPGIDALPTWEWCIPESVREPQDAILFLVALNSLNYMFWSRNDDGSIRRYFVGGRSGSNAMFETFRIAWGDASDPGHMRTRVQNISWFDGIFGSIPAQESRTRILAEVFSSTKLEQAAEHLLGRAHSGLLSADDAEFIGRLFPLSYGADPYLKKAQLAISAIAGWLGNRGMPIQCDVTAFADYQVPRVLKALGVLSYSPALVKSIAEGELIANKSIENAIRSATILAVEKIARKHGMPSALVDVAIWNSQELAANDRFHLTFTTDY